MQTDKAASDLISGLHTPLTLLQDSHIWPTSAVPLKKVEVMNPRTLSLRALRA